MKKLNSKSLTIITNVTLVILLLAVYAISFVPDKVIPIYGENKNQAIYNGNRESNKVSLMFNVYENKDVVLKIMDVLEEYQATATFFVGGCWADDNQSTLNQIVSRGHEIANHGYFHKDHKNLTYQKNVEEIENTNKIIQSLCGVKPKLFAPPSGSFSQTTLDACYDLGLLTIMWSKDTIDWRDKSEQVIYERATKNLRGGDLVLMHPKEHTLKALPKIMQYILDNNLVACTVSRNVTV